MTIHVANNKDISSWMELLDLVEDNFPGLEKEAYKKELHASILKKEALIAKEGDVLVGALIFSYDNNELLFLAVHPNYRNKGIARALIKNMTSLFQTGTQISVITYRQDDPQGVAARNLYLSLGFQCHELLTVFDYPCQKMILFV